MNNPFVPAEWRQTYDLAGAVWMPNSAPTRFGCSINEPMVTVDTVSDMSHTEGRLRYQEGSWIWPTHTAPILPFPAWVNAQGCHCDRCDGEGRIFIPLCPACGGCGETHPYDPQVSLCCPECLGGGDYWIDCGKCDGAGKITPRAVAIAALERAGFERDGLDMRVYIDRNKSLTALLFNNDHEFVMNAQYERDPAVSRYAQCCFEVLHAWAAAINWEVHDEH